MVSNDRSIWKRREVGTAVIIDPCMPIILCALLADTGLQLEEKWWMPQIERSNRLTVSEIADAPASFKCDVEASWFPRVKQ